MVLLKINTLISEEVFVGDKRLRTHLSTVFRYYGIQLIKEWVRVVYCWHVKVFVVSHNQCSDLVHKGELNEEVVVSKMETTM